MIRVKIIQTNAKEIFTKSKLPGVNYALNQYVGCGHNCSYCYARFISRWKGYGDWGSWIEIKVNAPELVKDKYIPGVVFMSSISDAYQPIEKKLELTKKVLENMNKDIKLSILTKSDLVLRDIDLLKQFKNVEIGFTLNSFEGKALKLLEPNAPSPEQRIEAMKTLKKNGIKTYAFVSPVIPGLIDLDKIVSLAKKHADYFWFEVINMRGAGKEFGELLKREFPESYQVLRDKKQFRDFTKKLGQKINTY